jgi:hypothetical protein
VRYVVRGQARGELVIGYPFLSTFLLVIAAFAAIMAFAAGLALVSRWIQQAKLGRGLIGLGMLIVFVAALVATAVTAMSP